MLLKIKKPYKNIRFFIKKVSDVFIYKFQHTEINSCKLFILSFILLHKKQLSCCISSGYHVNFNKKYS